MKSYEWLYNHAKDRFGDDLEVMLPIVLSPDELEKTSDDRLFSLLTRRVFRAGMKHSVIDAKWPAFEQAFWGFAPEKVSLMSDEQLEKLMLNDQIVRHFGKIKATRINAMMVTHLSDLHNGFGRYLAHWPSDNIIGLWSELKKEGAQLGGRSAASFLRMAGKDTFILNDDVVAALVAQDIVGKSPTSQRDLKHVQHAFNEWHQQSGRPLSHISQLLAFSVGWR